MYLQLRTARNLLLEYCGRQALYRRRGCVQRPFLYLGEINDSQHEAWCCVTVGAPSLGECGIAIVIPIAGRADAAAFDINRRWSICLSCHIHHHRVGQASPLLAPRATRLCQAKANRVRSSAPMPTGTTRKLHDMLLMITTSGSIPAGG